MVLASTEVVLSATGSAAIEKETRGAITRARKILVAGSALPATPVTPNSARGCDVPERRTNK